ncbi:MAG: Hint domain-containing protein [Marinovum sp.]|nr:Hint domain-containing protein [Marinovum sp.]
MALENLHVYNIATGDNTYPHSGDFTVTVAGLVTVDDSNGSRDAELGDFTDTGSSDVPDQNVTASTVTGINVGDTLDSRYTYTVTGSDGSSGNIYFLATNSTTNYGSWIVSDFPLDPAVTYTFGTFNRVGAVDYDDLVPCFAYGTLITTTQGEVPVQELTVGQEVLTLDRKFQKIRWIGGRTLDSIDLALKPKLRPIRIKAGALGSDLPVRDLLVSPQHRVLVRSPIVHRMFDTDSVLISAHKLLELDGIEVEHECNEVEYFHILFDQHEIVLSNGAPTESLYTGPEALKSLSLCARTEIEILFPEICKPHYNPTPARTFPEKGKYCKNLVSRHLKNRKTLLNKFDLPISI